MVDFLIFASWLRILLCTLNRVFSRTKSNNQKSRLTSGCLFFIMKQLKYWPIWQYVVFIGQTGCTKLTGWVDFVSCVYFYFTYRAFFLKYGSFLVEACYLGARLSSYRKKLHPKHIYSVLHTLLHSSKNT